ncbi:hypothetical protein A3842_08515 [Paenibacillus sp. P3E]|uniref:hypothetical protein n=1 Tax=unclassified Paenibacillus TaxID=185978 RepID=UPI00093AFAF8|nr:MULTISPECIES: hypothetical protein [unclassified Paenibacillus]OKP83928.1 hypothetical protein A3842_08515 [Paenibacillus sp. P3E]OKP90190.1 hypothetical protein A3848_12585 [Paenibacillus sp. P32E]
MTTTLFSREITYGKKDVAELESASIRVQLIYDKVLFMLHSHLPGSLWNAWIGVPYDIISSLYKGDNDSGSVFQKWIQSPSGWKCIGCERHCLEPSAGPVIPSSDKKRRFTFHNGIRQSMVLQAVIWSMYENTLLFQPYLGEESFLDEADLDTISTYFVPTYLSKHRLIENGKRCKEYQESNIRVYQEWIAAPDLVLQWNGGLTEGRWMTGVYVDHSRFAGLGPYLKDAQGKRTYMRATVE